MIHQLSFYEATILKLDEDITREENSRPIPLANRCKKLKEHISRPSSVMQKTNTSGAFASRAAALW